MTDEQENNDSSVTKWITSTKDLDDIKGELKLQQVNSKEDKSFDKMINAANRKIDNKLYPFKDEIPTSEVKVTDDLRDAAIQYVVYKYKKKQNNYDGAKAAKKDFEDTISDVIARYKANPEEQTRNKRVSTGTKYQTRKMFSQIKRY